MKVLITDHQQADTDLERALLAEHGIDLTVAQCRTPRDIIAIGADADAIFVQYAPITREVIEALTQLKVITINAVGTDNIDVAAAADRRVWVCNVPDASINEVSTHALAMALSLLRHLPQYDRSIRGGLWNPEATGPLHRPATLTLGILGLGAIGRALARIAAPCFKEIVACDPHLSAASWPDDVRRLTREAVFETSDVLSLHLPLLPETKGLVDKGLLSLMRPGSYLVNVSRGALVQLDALVELLDSGHIAAAALDVLPDEPPNPDSPILSHPQVLFSPHAAYYSVESEEELRRRAIGNILAWRETGTPTNSLGTGGTGK